MTEFKVWVEEVPVMGVSRLYLWGKENYYTITNGLLTANKIPETPERFENDYLLQGPSFIVNQFAEALSKWVEQKGGINTEQFNKGQVSRYENEVSWLRNTLTDLIKKP